MFSWRKLRCMGEKSSWMSMCAPLHWQGTKVGDAYANSVQFVKDMVGLWSGNTVFTILSQSTTRKHR